VVSIFDRFRFFPPKAKDMNWVVSIPHKTVPLQKFWASLESMKKLIQCGARCSVMLCDVCW
jgi:hypothetical protein